MVFNYVNSHTKHRAISSLLIGMSIHIFALSLPKTIYSPPIVQLRPFSKLRQGILNASLDSRLLGIDDVHDYEVLVDGNSVRNEGATHILASS
jgi:hypothetical protein